MFDISFSELLIIALVALVVIGPEKLPKVARTVGLLVGRFQRFASQVKDEVNREARFEDLQRLQGEVQQSILSVEERASKLVADIQAPQLSPQNKPAKRTAEVKTNTLKRSKSEAVSNSRIAVESIAKPQSGTQTKSPKIKQPKPESTKQAPKVSRSV